MIFNIAVHQKTEVKVRKVGLSLESNLLRRLDDYAERKFKGNRLAAANYLLSALARAGDPSL